MAQAHCVSKSIVCTSALADCLCNVSIILVVFKAYTFLSINQSIYPSMYVSVFLFRYLYCDFAYWLLYSGKHAPNCRALSIQEGKIPSTAVRAVVSRKGGCFGSTAVPEAASFRPSSDSVLGFRCACKGLCKGMQMHILRRPRAWLLSH